MLHRSPEAIRGFFFCTRHQRSQPRSADSQSAAPQNCILLSARKSDASPANTLMNLRNRPLSVRHSANRMSALLISSPGVIGEPISEPAAKRYKRRKRCGNTAFSCVLCAYSYLVKPHIASPNCWRAEWRLMKANASQPPHCGIGGRAGALRGVQGLGVVVPEPFPVVVGVPPRSAGIGGSSVAIGLPVL